LDKILVLGRDDRQIAELVPPWAAWE
jgi:hypothetical protein